MLKNDKIKLIIIVAGIGIVLIVGLLLALTVISSAGANKNNLTIDGVASKMEDPELITFDSANNAYICIEKIAPLVNYEFYNGGYNDGTEDKTKCYIKNANEIATFEMDSSVIYKLELANTDGLYDKYIMTLATKRINDKLYISLPAFQRAFNVQVMYEPESNNLSINTLPYLVTYYETYVAEQGYTSLAKEFSNQKALLQGLLVVLKDRTIYGVINLEGQQVIGTKYDAINYIESTSEFLVKSGTKYGVLTSTAEQKIDLTYESIKVIDNEENLYLVLSNDKYGVLDKNGSVLLYIQYDYIGIKNVENFPNDNIKNPYVIRDSAIPVCQNGKWGFFDLSGNQLLPIRFATLGCVVSTSKNQLYKNVLLIPETEGAEGVVVGNVNSSNVTTYGIASLQRKNLLTPVTFSKIYRDVSNGESAFYMVFGTTVSTVKSRIASNITEVTNSNNSSGNVVEVSSDLIINNQSSSVNINTSSNINVNTNINNNTNNTTNSNSTVVNGSIIGEDEEVIVTNPQNSTNSQSANDGYVTIPNIGS